MMTPEQIARTVSEDLGFRAGVLIEALEYVYAESLAQTYASDTDFEFGIKLDALEDEGWAPEAIIATVEAVVRRVAKLIPLLPSQFDYGAWLERLDVQQDEYELAPDELADEFQRALRRYGNLTRLFNLGSDVQADFRRAKWENTPEAAVRLTDIITEQFFMLIDRSSDLPLDPGGDFIDRMVSASAQDIRERLRDAVRELMLLQDRLKGAGVAPPEETMEEGLEHIYGDTDDFDFGIKIDALEDDGWRPEAIIITIESIINRLARLIPLCPSQFDYAGWYNRLNMSEVASGGRRLSEKEAVQGFEQSSRNYGGAGAATVAGSWVDWEIKRARQQATLQAVIDCVSKVREKLYRLSEHHGFRQDGVSWLGELINRTDEDVSQRARSALAELDILIERLRGAGILPPDEEDDLYNAGDDEDDYDEGDPVSESMEHVYGSSEVEVPIRLDALEDDGWPDEGTSGLVRDLIDRWADGTISMRWPADRLRAWADSIDLPGDEERDDRVQFVYDVLSSGLVSRAVTDAVSSVVRLANRLPAGFATSSSGGIARQLRDMLSSSLERPQTLRDRYEAPPAYHTTPMDNARRAVCAAFLSHFVGRSYDLLADLDEVARRAPA